MNRGKTILFLIIAFACHKIHAGNLPKNLDRQPVVKQFINHSDWNFVENKGQLASFNKDIKYYGHQGGVNVYCKPGMISFVFTKTEKKNNDQVSEATGMAAPYPLKGGHSPNAIGRAKSTALVPTYSGGDLGVKPDKITLARADLILLNSNPSAEIIASDRQEYYENYYTTGNADSGITNVHTYKTITYKSIYPNIDMVLHAKAGSMKYEFVVYPGGNVGDIQMQWNGLENIKNLKNSGIEYSLALGTLSESAPYTFVRADPCVRPYFAADASIRPYSPPFLSAWADTRGRPYESAPEEIESSFILKSNRVGFKVDRYDESKVLVIDPTLIWGTYFGGNGQDGATGVATDGSGNVYITGITNSKNNIATFGAFQTSYAGGNDDIFISEFSSKGNLMWSTYFGSDDDDVPSVIKIDFSGNILIVGNIEGSSSASGMVTSGAYQTIKYGGDEGFIAKFFPSGMRDWSTYFGGTNYTYTGGICNTYISGLDCDKNNNIYITGATESSSKIATPGAYQTIYRGGPTFPQEDYDAFVAKFSPAGNITWSSYFGDSENDYGRGIAVDNSGNVFITGGTKSLSGIATYGSYQTSYGGNQDAFVAKFNNTGTTLLWSSYFGGSSMEDVRGICTDAFGYIYITGSTTSSNGIASSGSHQTYYAGGNNTGDAFLAKFSNSGTRIWSTYYGGKGDDAGSDVITDALSNVYISGNTASNNGIATTGAYSTSYAGGYDDAFLAKFSKTGSLSWGTYYGGKDYDEAYGLSSDFAGNIYFAGFTLSDSGIATQGAYQTSYRSGNEDAFLAKFGIKYPNDAGIDSLISPVGNYCIDTLPVSFQLQNFGLNELDSVKISLSIKGKLLSPYSWSGHLLTDSTIIVNLGTFTFPPGTDTIKAWTYLPNGVQDSFPGNDTSTAIIHVYSLPNPNAGPDTTLCYDESYTMQGSGGITYLWHPATYLSSATDPKAVAILPNTERYELIVTNSIGCSDSAPVLLKVRPKLKVKAFALNNPACFGSPVTLYAKGSGGDSLHYQYQWATDALTGDTIIEKPTQSGWHEVILSDNCSATNGIDSAYVTVTPPPKADFVYVPAQLVKVNQNVSFQNRSSNAAKYLWEFGANDSSTIVSPDHIYTDSGEYKVVLIAYGLNHCPNDTAYGFIKILGTQFTLYIPDAFSPNNDGINDYFDISGVGIKSYSYNIYNRWGEHIFSANSGVPPLGGQGVGAGTAAWDGTFKGAPAPESIYIYQLDVTDIEGKHHFLSGNISLIR